MSEHLRIPMEFVGFTIFVWIFGVVGIAVVERTEPAFLSTRGAVSYIVAGALLAWLSWGYRAKAAGHEN
ncbi:hypothetical protein [Qipengyuania seohaensis]|uniref:hypothetical protein n=1 Tax=Qipengyuania seohaensis TaxID=266951 RepID=UPI0012FD1883|nr:hypothetical protein [Qipengyuania seohaensis]